jgi:hypothetical protein
MNNKHLLLTGLCALALGGLTGCETIPVSSNNGPGYGNYNYNRPARVTQLTNGNYLVNIDGKVASFNRNGNLMSGIGLSSSQLAHAEMAVRYYNNGHRGDYYHPNYAPPSYRPPAWRPDGPDFNRPDPGYGRAPEVRPRGDGMIEVLMPRGGVVLYDRNGRLVQKGGTVSGSELDDANKAVQSYLREQTSSRGYDGV